MTWETCESLVFSIDVYADGSWEASGALELALISDSEFLLLFRKPTGQIFDVTTGTDRVDGQFKIPWNDEATVAMAFTVQKLDQGEAASFKGTIQTAKNKDKPVRGTFAAKREITQAILRVIHQGPSDIPTRVSPFLDIEPWGMRSADIPENTQLGWAIMKPGASTPAPPEPIGGIPIDKLLEMIIKPSSDVRREGITNSEAIKAFDGEGLLRRFDQVGMLNSYLFHNTVLQCLPEYARQRWYKGQVQDPSDYISAVQKTLSQCSEKTKDLMRLSCIISDNREFVEAAAIHIMVRDMKKQDWVTDMHRQWLVDKCETFFAILALPGTDVRKDPSFSGLFQTYGNGYLKEENLDKCVASYRNTLRRCYLAAYIYNRPVWAQFLAKPEESLKDIIDYLYSDEYRQHWLPTLVDVAESKLSIPLKTRLGTLGDKLLLLQHVVQHNSGQVQDPATIEDLINRLITDAKQTGLLRESLIEYRAGEVQQEFYDALPIGRLTGDTELAWHFLDQDTMRMINTYVRPLGLYSGPNSQCTIM